MHFVQAKGLLSKDNGMNIYRGCSHGCIYCDSRSRCYGFTHAFEDIEVKENAPELLEKALRSKRQKCKEAGIPTVVWLTPILPFINDTADNIKNLLDACVDAGVKGIIFWGIGVTLRDGDREYFYHALDQDFPGMKEKYIRTYGNAYNLPSPNEKMLIPMIVEQCQKAGILCSPDECFAYLHHFPEKYVQRSLFD